MLDHNKICQSRVEHVLWSKERYLKNVLTFRFAVLAEPIKAYSFPQGLLNARLCTVLPCQKDYCE